ncbi:MAG: single-stranded-DNA-specific exonuclease RecJ [Kastovskya adunca ATA6-11-RM4]|jgi:single-stranded-DNA-specific exonuclease|nr:single-stranded-DNA-specific exonuclease RecJ [Kastovskya adunca ATA6-11-RM4]
MPEPQLQWQVSPPPHLPQWFIDAVKRHSPTSDGRYAAQLLWQRGIQDPEQLAGFLDPKLYKPASPFAFGQEMHWAVERLQQARDRREKVAVWGDFDADGITSTAVLWEGLGQFLPQRPTSPSAIPNSGLSTQHSALTYYIPNRLTESHGLNNRGIDALASQGVTLIVTCDTGSTNLSEIDYAESLGMGVIITDHHTLPPERPPVVAIINPRYFAEDHQLFHLSGVAVAYKLVEALYSAMPDVPKQPLENLLDLVAIGLIADLVQLSGDCRYLAQLGIGRLQKNLESLPISQRRPGVTRLLELCQRSGDRPTDISFGIGPRINAVSRIQGDASFCVELLTSRDEQRCHELAWDTELANARRKSLQKDVMQQVQQKLAQLDLSTTSVIVLCDEQWQPGVLGLVAGQIAQEYGRPTILLSTADNFTADAFDSERPMTDAGEILARGSARSVNQIDLYQLVKSQEHLLHRFGGHPFAAGLSLPAENIPLFTEAINQQLRQQGVITGKPTMTADLVVPVAELSKELFRELKLLEPCGMGNPVPKLLIENCWFSNVWNRNTQDVKGRKVQYIKTEFEIWDDSSPEAFAGIWWGHYQDELPKGRCDAIVELDYNNYKKRTEVRLLAVQPRLGANGFNRSTQQEWILDWREEEDLLSVQASNYIILKECPSSWDELQVWFRRATQSERPLAIAYSPPEPPSPRDVWEQLIGIAKYLSRTGESATLAQLSEKLDLSDRSLHLGLQALSHLGFQVKHQDWAIQVSWQASGGTADVTHDTILTFLAAIKEEQFRRRYFSQVPLSTIQSMAAQTLLNQ